jgi:hypothetical protein
LPREWTRRPITPPGNNLLTAADDLIDPATGDWDREGGRRQADLSLAVNEGRQNWLAWNFDSKGASQIWMTNKKNKGPV